MTTTKHLNVRLSLVTAVAGAVSLFLPITAGSASAASASVASVPPTAPGAYHALAPDRVTDTRPGSGLANAGNTLGPGGTLTVTMPSAVPPTATAVALSVIAVDGTTNSYLSVYPTGQVPSTPTSVVNYVAGGANCTIPDCVASNLVVSKTNGGQVTVANGSPTGSVDVVVDLEGYFDPTGATTSSSGHYLPVMAERLADTRCAGSSPPGFCAGENLPPGQSSTLGPGGTLGVPVTVVGAPGQGIAAVVVQITATDTTANGYLTAYAAGTKRPTASNVNFVAGQTSSNRAIVPVGPGGGITIYNSHGKTDVVVDIVGCFSNGAGAATAGSLYTPIVPARIADTRTGQGPGPLAANSASTFPVTGQAGIPDQVNGSPTAAFLNVTEASATAAGYLTVTPATASPPVSTSDVNFNAGEIRANADTAELGAPAGTVSIYNYGVIYDYADFTQVVIDAFGYFSSVVPPSPSAPCTSTQIAVTVGFGFAAGGHEGRPLLFTNKADTTCVLSGYPRVALLNASGQQVLQAEPIPSGYLGGLRDGSTTPPVLDVVPGQTVSALLEGIDNPQGGATSCPSYPAVLVTPPNQTSSVPLNMDSGNSPGGFPGCSTPQIHPAVTGTYGQQQ